jgi:hypothetical protein
MTVEAGEVFRVYFLPRQSRRGLLPSHRQVIPFPDDICARLFSLAPDLRFDRRDIDYDAKRAAEITLQPIRRFGFDIAPT